MSDFPVDEENERRDDAIDEWHSHPEWKIPLHEHLGMTWEDYAAWVKDPNHRPKREDDDG